MNRDAVIVKLVPVLHDVFDNDEIVYRDDLSAADVEEWDSLSNVRLMVSVERAFSTRFSNAEWEGLTKLGDLVAMLERR